MTPLDTILLVVAMLIFAAGVAWYGVPVGIVLEIIAVVITTAVLYFTDWLFLPVLIVAEIAVFISSYFLDDFDL